MSELASLEPVSQPSQVPPGRVASITTTRAASRFLRFDRSVERVLACSFSARGEKVVPIRLGRADLRVQCPVFRSLDSSVGLLEDPSTVGTITSREARCYAERQRKR